MSEDHREWGVWSTTASVVVTRPHLLDDAEAIARDVIAGVDEACSRFRDDSELSRLHAELAGGVEVSPLLAELVGQALLAASWTDGSVDPTLGNDLIALGYDRDIEAIRGGGVLGAVTPTDAPGDTTAGISLSVERPRSPGWRRVVLDGRMLTVPTDLLLDLGATAKAVTADLAAARIVDELGGGVLVSLGGDIATAGATPVGAWQVTVQDAPSDPVQQVSLRAGSAVATSSTQKRRWVTQGRPVHHILDPRFGLPVEPVWRSVSVAADSCLRANALSTASIVRGHAAVDWLRSVGADARLVDRAGRTVVTGAWPQPAADERESEAVAWTR